MVRSSRYYIKEVDAKGFAGFADNIPGRVKDLLYSFANCVSERLLKCCGKNEWAYAKDAIV